MGKLDAQSDYIPIFGRPFMPIPRKNWRKRQAIRTKKCHAYLESRGYACGLDNVGFGLEEAYNFSKHPMASTQRHIRKKVHDSVFRGPANSTGRDRFGSSRRVPLALLS